MRNSSIFHIGKYSLFHTIMWRNINKILLPSAFAAAAVQTHTIDFMSSTTNSP